VRLFYCKLGGGQGSGLAAFYADAYPEHVSSIVFLDPMPITKAYAEQRSKKLDSLYIDQERDRLKQLEKSFTARVMIGFRRFVAKGLTFRTGSIFIHPKTDDIGRWDICDSSPTAIRNQSVVFAGVLKPLGDFDLRPVLSRLKVPILVLEGEETNVPLDATKEWAKAPHNARMVLVPMLDTQPL
jgi:pimeloyl-ACP methyl ester carboxylesterase